MLSANCGVAGAAVLRWLRNEDLHNVVGGEARLWSPVGGLIRTAGCISGLAVEGSGIDHDIDPSFHVC